MHNTLNVIYLKSNIDFNQENAFENPIVLFWVSRSCKTAGLFNEHGNLIEFHDGKLIENFGF